MIVGGSNLYSKRGEVHAPDIWPQYYSSAHGIHITDLDGRTYRDFSGAGVGSSVLGWADPDVDAAVVGAIKRGSISALLAPEEVELAKMLVQLHPWAQQVRYTRSGGEAMAVAIRIAQAKTGRSNIWHQATSYHGWHVNNPLSREAFLPYTYGEPPAAIIIEPSRLHEPETGELEEWRQRADDLGAVLIFDEISSGFRRNLGGVHLHYGVQPDVAVFAKAMSNGYPMAAVIGTESVMSAANDTFISSTSWTDRIGPVAALATIQKLWSKDVFAHTKQIGEWVGDTIRYEAKRAGIEVKVHGLPQMLHFNFGPVTQTAFTISMLNRGFLAGRDFYPSYAHTLEDCEDFAAAVRDSFAEITEHPTTMQLVEQGIRR